jgi:hypothetical protein
MLVGSAHAAQTYPGPFVGSDVTYSSVTEASGDPVNDPEPLFGAPAIISPNTLDFDPIAEAFSSAAPPSDVTDGSLSFLVESNTSALLESITISEGGDFFFQGAVATPSPNSESVGAALIVQIRDADTEAVLLQDSVDFFQAYTSAPVQTGFWDMDLDFDVASLGRTELLVTLNNIVAASSVTGNTATIRKKDFDVTTTVIPEPGTVLLLASGGLLMMVRKRRNA